MKGVRFGTIHSFDEWGLVLTSKEIGAAVPKTRQIEIEGGNGVIDLTDFFGGVKYKNRLLSFNFIKPNISSSESLALYERVQNEIHGKERQVILDDDPGYYYYGRISVNEWKSKKNYGEIAIEVDAEPFKTEVTSTIRIFDINGSANIVIPNDKKPAIPTVTNEESFTITYNGYTATYPANSTIIPELELQEGNNQMRVVGTGRITFEFMKGRL